MKKNLIRELSKEDLQYLEQFKSLAYRWDCRTYTDKSDFITVYWNYVQSLSDVPANSNDTGYSVLKHNDEYFLFVDYNSPVRLLTQFPTNIEIGDHVIGKLIYYYENNIKVE